MSTRMRLVFGPVAACLLLVGVVGLAWFVPDYSATRQTVSEIGEASSPMRWPFALVLCGVALCVWVFATALHAMSRAHHRPAWGAYLIGCMAVSVAGVGLFAFPHPLHNVFGLSELIGYQAPLALALGWRRDPVLRPVARASWLFFVLIWIALALNLSTLDRQGALFLRLQPVFGLVQRSLFAAWFGWCAVIGVIARARIARAEPRMHTTR